MMRLFIPPVGTKIRLTSSWCFSLYKESRNFSLFKLFLIEDEHMWNGYGDKVQDVTLPEDTVLKVRRIYVKQGAPQYNSVTFTIDKKLSKLLFKPKGTLRFWAKLDDVNKIECEIVEDV